MNNPNTSNSVDEEIFRCLDLDNPKSFFLFAGAGSGKTRSLVEVLKRFRHENIDLLRKKAQKIAIITYTNAACDEIKSRLEFDDSFLVSTIHSFAWELIRSYISDIKRWIKTSLENDINDLEEKQNKAKNTNTKTYIDRKRKIESKKSRLESLSTIRRFTYNPNGDNIGQDSLNHTEVINIAADFIQNRQLMQNILVRTYPILLIDESQDTKKELIDAFFEVQKQKSDCFALGLFGDTMQRIYADGKPDLDKIIPDSWAKPAKKNNYRCPKRVIKLINKIRTDVDDQKQESAKIEEGYVRLFIVDTNQSQNKIAIENNVMKRMAKLTNDTEWDSSSSTVKVLTLEHHMAAKRGGFSEFFDPLYKVNKFKTGLLDGTMSSVNLFVKQILPLIKAKNIGDEFAVTRIVQKYSPLLYKNVLKNKENPINSIREAGESVRTLYSLWGNGADPTLADILKIIYQTKLFHVPETLLPIAQRLAENNSMDDSDETDSDAIIDALEEALQCKFSCFEEYVKYISDESRFGTHQGIKGLEFPRVMVILDDDEARGFMFSYDKLLGVKQPSTTDIQNRSSGKENSIDRTIRLFYVTCSRAEESLAIVAYTKTPNQLKQYVLEQEWFGKDEIQILKSEGEK